MRGSYRPPDARDDLALSVVCILLLSHEGQGPCSRMHLLRPRSLLIWPNPPQSKLRYPAHLGWLDIERPDIEIAIALSKILCSGQGIIQHHPGAINDLLTDSISGTVLHPPHVAPAGLSLQLNCISAAVPGVIDHRIAAGRLQILR